METEAGSMAAAEVEPDPVLIQVRVPDIGLEKCLPCPQEERVYDVKQQILAAMPKVRHNQFIIFCLPKKRRRLYVFPCENHREPECSLAQRTSNRSLIQRDAASFIILSIYVHAAHSGQ